MTNVRTYNDKQLLAKVKSLPSFKSIPEGYWILGVRSNEDAPNKYDDKFYIFKGEKFDSVLLGTTNPGTPILEGGFIKYNKVGAAIVKADEWYYDVWTYGLHMGKMPALKQVGNFIVFRDGDRDNKAEELGVPIKGSGYGINFHAATWDENFKGEQENIGNWSAGCQVCNNKQKHLAAVKMMKSQKRVTYVLLNEFEAA